MLAIGVFCMQGELNLTVTPALAIPLRSKKTFKNEHFVQLMLSVALIDHNPISSSCPEELEKLFPVARL
jgi:hypothetical protein